MVPQRSRKKAGHRSWAPGNAPVPGKHRGDTMTPATRSRVMAKIKSKNTKPELTIFRELRRRKIYFAKHASDLPGKPDILFRKARLAVFIDGDFWHGWRLPLWKHKLSPAWQKKLMDTRARDQRNFRHLRCHGWKVLRIWEHSVESDPIECVNKIVRLRDECLSRTGTR